MRHQRTFPRIASAALAAAVLASPLLAAATACGRAEVDDARIAETLRAQLQGQGVRADDLECPDLPAEVGRSARCTFSVDGQPVDAVATVAAVDGDAVTYAVRAQARPVGRQLLERVVADRLAREGVPAGTATCAGDLPASVGATVTCAVAGAGDWTVRTAAVDGGRIDWSLEQVGLA